MAKVITTIVAEDGTAFKDIRSFKTKNYIGIWHESSACFALLEKYSAEFCPYYLMKCNNLKELDERVFAACTEHIDEVFKSSTYEFVLQN